MTAALRYEWVRLTTVRSTWIMLVLALVFGGGIGYLASNPPTVYDESGTVIGEGTPDWWGAFAFPLTLTAVLASVIAAQAIGQEYRFGLIRLTLTAFPQRSRILVAKLTLVTVAAVAVALATYAGSWVAVVLRGYPLPPDDVTPVDSTFLLRGVVYVVLWALSAFALAGITRQTALGVAVPIISGLIVETLVAALLSNRARWLVDVLPWSTASRWSQTQPEGFVDEMGNEILAQAPPVGWGALGVFGVWVVVMLAVQAVAFVRRDA